MPRRLRVHRNHPLYKDIVALNAAVSAMRHALGKRNPEDLCYGSPEWEAANEDFVRDLIRMMGAEPADLE